MNFASQRTESPRVGQPGAQHPDRSDDMASKDAAYAERKWGFVLLARPLWSCVVAA